MSHHHRLQAHGAVPRRPVLPVHYGHLPELEPGDGLPGPVLQVGAQLINLRRQQSHNVLRCHHHLNLGDPAQLSEVVEEEADEGEGGEEEQSHGDADNVPVTDHVITGGALRVSRHEVDTVGVSPIVVITAGVCRNENLNCSNVIQKR